MAERLRPTSPRRACCSSNMIDGGKDFRHEGAERRLLGIDHGTYPYVAVDYNCTAGGASYSMILR